MKLFLKQFKTKEVDWDDEDKVLSYYITVRMEDGYVFTIIDEFFKLTEYEGKWIEALLNYYPPGSWQPIEGFIDGMYIKSHNMKESQISKYIYRYGKPSFEFFKECNAIKNP